MSDQVTFTLPDEAATLRLGAIIADLKPIPQSVFLYGELGAGKTTMVRGLLRQMGYQGPVKSPTYTLIESYELERYSVHHLDLYRLTDPEELDYLGVRDLTGILLIEWPERAEGLLGEPDLEVRLNHAGHHRAVTFNPLFSELANAMEESGYGSE